mmetsp:Transcript_5234/g.19184  ORF Transcript_5234/g.19184 Transcript_5234/m.19184 type:complete len:660 (-) Transcript_5234:68-2047(-)
MVKITAQKHVEFVDEEEMDQQERGLNTHSVPSAPVVSSMTTDTTSGSFTNGKPDPDQDDNELKVKVAGSAEAFSVQMGDSEKNMKNEIQSDGGWIGRTIDKGEEVLRQNGAIIWKIVWIVALLGFFAFLIAGLVLNFDKTVSLLVITCVVVGWIIFAKLQEMFGERALDSFNTAKKPAADIINSNAFCEKYFWALVALTAVLAFFIWLLIDTLIPDPQRFQSLIGLIVYILLCYIFSWHRHAVNWRTVCWGFALQFILGFFILRTQPGRDAFEWLGDLVETFLSYSSEGALFVFGAAFPQLFNDAATGEPNRDPFAALQAHNFAFSVLPTIIYFSAFIAIMYHVGAIQFVIRVISFWINITMQTSAPETVNAVGNIFVGQTEAPLLIKPFIGTMTRSELHAVMTGGFATVSGGILAAYTSFGIPATQLLSASVMSAPAALAISKIIYPETKKVRFPAGSKIEVEGTGESNMIEAAANGASAAIPLVANVAANLIAFLSLLELLNEILAWLGRMVGMDCDESLSLDGIDPTCDDELSFEKICSYLFIPFAWLLGVEPADCQEVAILLGKKTFINEFVAYIDLGIMIANDEISDRSATIAVYALCGFANIGSLGIQLGGLGPLAPHRRTDMAEIVLSAMIAGTVACFSTACVAALLTESPD